MSVRGRYVVVYLLGSVLEKLKMQFEDEVAFINYYTPTLTSVRPSVRPSVIWLLFFVKNFFDTVQARVIIFGMQVDNDVLYRGIADQPSHAYSSQYLSDFLSFLILNDDFFVKDFCETVQAGVFIYGMQVENPALKKWEYTALHLSVLPSVRPSVRPSFRSSITLFRQNFSTALQARTVIFGIQIDDDMSYCGIANQTSPAYSSLYLSNFLSLHTLIMKSFVKDFFETVQARVFIYGMHVDNDVLYRGNVNQPSHIYFPHICPIFFLSIL